MADTTLAASTLAKTSGSPVVGTDVLRIVRSTTSYQITAAHLATYMATAMSALALSATTIELGHASDTTISRASAGRIAVEGSNVLMASDIGVTVQAYDADLAAWAGVNPTLYSTTAQIAAAYQPLDSDLTAIAALSTTSTGRALLTVADAAAIRTAAGLGTSATVNTGTSGATVPLLNGTNTWSGLQTYTAAFFQVAHRSSVAGFGGIAWQNNSGVSRWADVVENDGTGNARIIYRYDASGVYAGTTLHLNAANGNATFEGTVTTSGGTINTAAYKATGTSGNTVPLLDGANTWSGVQAFQATTQPIAIRGASDTETRIDYNGATQKTSWVTTNLARNAYGAIEHDALSHTWKLGGSNSLVLASGAITFGGVAIPTISSTDTLSNKTIASPTLSGTVTASGSIVLASATPQIDFNDTNSTSTERYWRLSTSGNQLNLDLCNDAGAGQTNQLSIARTGTTASSSVITANGSWAFSGAVTVGGNAVMTVAGGTFTGNVNVALGNARLALTNNSGTTTTLTLGSDSGSAWIGTTTNHEFGIYMNAAKVAYFGTIGGGLVVGTPTGGEKGGGTINAAAVYDDNTLLTDLVLDLAVAGTFDAQKYAAHPIAKEVAPWWFDPDQYAEFWKANRHLPGMAQWTDEANKPSTGALTTRLTAVVETHAVLLANDNDRIKALEAEVLSLKALLAA